MQYSSLYEDDIVPNYALKMETSKEGEVTITSRDIPGEVWKGPSVSKAMQVANEGMKAHYQKELVSTKPKWMDAGIFAKAK